MSPDPASVYIVESNPVVVRGLREFLKAAHDFEIVGTHTIAEEAWPEIHRIKPKLLITGIDVPAMEGVALTAKMSKDFPVSRTVVFTHFRQPQVIFQAMEAGAAAYILMNVRPPELARALRGVLHGEMIIDHAVIGNVARALGKSNAIIPQLSGRERDILKLVADGCSIKEIARRVSLSPDSVKHHLKGIYEKLGVKNQAAAVARSFRLGFIE